MNDIFFALWFFLPVGVANVTPIFVSHISFLKPFTFPLDFYLTFHGKRVFGDHKTIRGFVVGLVAAIMTVFLQKYLYEQNPDIHSFVPVDYRMINPFVFGSLAALGSILGDAIKSFFKRQLNIEEGKSWFPFDQVDYILGGIIFTYFYIPLRFDQYILLFVVWFVIHITSTITGYLFHLKKTPI